MIKRIVFSLLFLQQLAHAQSNSISAFVYHRFGDDRYPSTNIKLDQFEAHLQYLKENGYQTLTLSEALATMKGRAKKNKLAVLTVDDGYSTFYKNALPLLKKYGFTATLFVNTETVGASDFMSWAELKAAESAGIEIGNHSHSHAFFLNEGSVDFQQDLATSEAVFQQNLGRIPKVYAYPYGEWNETMAIHLESKGYLGAVAQNSGVMSGISPQFSLPRFPMSEVYADLKGFVSKLKTTPIDVKAIKVTTEGYLGSSNKPRIDIEFDEGNLKMEQLQCFIQGANCQKSIQIVKDGIVKLNARPDRDLKRRRTLYTITVPDKEGIWHWFSYSWVQPKIKE